jgi:hypothetical protein
MLTADEPVMVKPRLADAQSMLAVEEPRTEVMLTSEEPRVEPHEDAPCVPGTSKIFRGVAEVVATSAEAMESHGVAHAPQEDALEAVLKVETNSELRASTTGTIVGEVEALATVVVAALTRYTMVDGLATAENVYEVVEAP